MMSKKPLDEQARDFWSAAYYYRRARDRDTSTAVKILRRIHETATGLIHDRAEEILKGIEDGSATGT